MAQLQSSQLFFVCTIPESAFAWEMLSHPTLSLLAFPMVEFAMSKIFLSKNKWPANSMSEIILEFLYFVTELVLHAQRPMKAVPSIQGQSRSFCGVRRHIVSKNAAINFLHVCGGLD